MFLRFFTLALLSLQGPPDARTVPSGVFSFPFSSSRSGFSSLLLLSVAGDGVYFARGREEEEEALALSLSMGEKRPPKGERGGGGGGKRKGKAQQICTLSLSLSISLSLPLSLPLRDRLERRNFRGGGKKDGDGAVVLLCFLGFICDFFPYKFRELSYRYRTGSCVN